MKLFSRYVEPDSTFTCKRYFNHAANVTLALIKRLHVIWEMPWRYHICTRVKPVRSQYCNQKRATVRSILVTNSIKVLIDKI